MCVCCCCCVVVVVVVVVVVLGEVYSGDDLVVGCTVTVFAVFRFCLLAPPRGGVK